MYFRSLDFRFSLNALFNLPPYLPFRCLLPYCSLIKWHTMSKNKSLSRTAPIGQVHVDVVVLDVAEVDTIWLDLAHSPALK